MRAVTFEQYGPPEVLQLKEVEKPTPKADEVLVKVHATSVTSGEVKIRSFKNIPPLFWLPGRLVYGLLKPKQRILGFEFAGQVESVGAKVKSFKPGHHVFGMDQSGAYAEYKTIAETKPVALMPPGLSFEEAAAIPFGALSALHFLRKANLTRGEKIVIVGAAGSVGSSGVQIAKHFGAEVTGVCARAQFELVKSLGADHVIDYNREDFRASGRTYDIIFDTVGATDVFACKQTLNPNGRHLFTVFASKELLHALLTSVVGDKKVLCDIAKDTREGLLFIRGLVETGALRPVIDRCYPLEQVAEAHGYVEQGNKSGSVVVRVG